MTRSNDARLIGEGDGKFAPSPHVWLSDARAQIRRVAKLLAARRQRAREFQDLYRLSERELWDVGLSRSDFPAIEKGSFRRK